MYDADIQVWMQQQRCQKLDATTSGNGFLYDPLQFQSLESKRNGTRNGRELYVGVTQMIPNASKLKADFNLMNAMSSVEKENKTIQLIN
jgi:hypothetical protein